MDKYEEYERNGLTVTIYDDDDPENPRNWDNLGKMICSHRNYDLGDEQFNSDDYAGWDDLKKHLIDDEGAVIVLPLGLYDHSGITMYVGDTHDRWDGGQVGFVYVTKKDLENEQAADPTYNLERAEACVRSEVETYDAYLRGEVYGFTVTNPKNSEELDSCWGFYSIEDCRDEANSNADAYVHPHDAAYAKNAREVHV